PLGYPSSYHAFPHSFPTRRSSDLTARPADSRLTAAKNRLPSARSEPILCRTFPSGRGWPRRHTSTSSLSFQMRQLLLRRDAATEDRKSTRLNSSHQII